MFPGPFCFNFVSFLIIYLDTSAAFFMFLYGNNGTLQQLFCSSNFILSRIRFNCKLPMNSTITNAAKTVCGETFIGSRMDTVE